MENSPQSPPPPGSQSSAPLPPPRQGKAPRAHADDKKENYSYDEMMSRLRSGRGSGSSSGARRKRRSGDLPQSGRKSGPSKQDLAYGGLGLSKRGMWIVASLLLVFLLGVGGFFGYHWLTRFRLEGNGFQVNVGRRLSEIFNRQVTLARFRQGPVRDLSNAEVSMDGRFGDLMERATFHDVNLILSPAAWVGGDWDITTLRMREGLIQLNPGRTLDAGMRSQPVQRSAEPAGSGWGVSSTPTAISVETGIFDELTLKWPGPLGKPESLSKLSGSFRFGTGALETEIKEGTLDTEAWPPFAVKWIKSRLVGTNLEITEARLALSEKSQARLRGQASLVPDGSLSLHGDLDPVQVKDLIPSGWGQRVLGMFSSPTFTWESKFQSGAPAELKGPFLVQGLALRNMPFLDKFAALVQQPDYQLLEFPEVKGDFSWSPDRTLITGLKGERPGLVRISGDLEVSSSGLVKGNVRLEVSALQLVGLKGGRPAHFSPAAEEGWSVIEFELNGTSQMLTDSIPMASPSMIGSGSAVARSLGAPPVPAAAPAPVPAAPVPDRPLDVPTLIPSANESGAPVSSEKAKSLFFDLIGK